MFHSVKAASRGISLSLSLSKLLNIASTISFEFKRHRYMGGMILSAMQDTVL